MMLWEYFKQLFKTEPRKKIALVVGHCVPNQGAFSEALNCHEFEYNSTLAFRIKENPYLANVDVEVFFRNNNNNIQEVYGRVKGWCPDLVVSLHFNSANTTAAHGSEVWYSDSHADNADFAFNMLLRCLEALSLRNRGTKEATKDDRANGILKQIQNIPMILIEPFFGSNEGDSISARENMIILADRLAHGLKQQLT